MFNDVIHDIVGCAKGRRGRGCCVSRRRHAGIAGWLIVSNGRLASRNIANYFQVAKRRLASSVRRLFFFLGVCLYPGSASRAWAWKTGFGH